MKKTVSITKLRDLISSELENTYTFKGGKSEVFKHYFSLTSNSKELGYSNIYLFEADKKKTIEIAFTTDNPRKIFDIIRKFTDLPITYSITTFKQVTR